MGCVEEKDNDMTYCCLDEALSLPFLMLMLSVYCTWKDNLTWPTLIEHLYDIVVLMSTYFHSYIPLFLVMFSTVLKTIKKKHSYYESVYWQASGNMINMAIQRQQYDIVQYYAIL